MICIDGTEISKVCVGGQSADKVCFDGSQMFTSGPPFSAAAAPTVVSRHNAFGGPTTTPVASVTVTGGTGPFTYSWEYVSGDIFTTNSPTSASTTWTTETPPDKDGFYRCVVTDTSDGTTTTTNNVRAAARSSVI